MTTASKALAARLKAFNDELIRFIQTLDPQTWHKTCDSENWPINVVAHHIGYGHYRAFGLAKQLSSGAPVPEFSHDAVDAMNKAHAAKFADCTKEEVLAILEKYGTAMAGFVDGLTDEQLNRTGNVPAMGGSFSAKQILEVMVLESGEAHMVSMRTTAAG